VIQPIPVHDAVGMHGADCGGDFVEDVAGLLLWEIVLIDDDIEQLLPFAELRDYVLVLSLLEYLVYFKNAGVVLSWE
jgi:hypothetical protein